MSHARVTITLPVEIVEDIDRLEENRSRFILDAVRRELTRRRRQELRQSLREPHPESVDLAEVDIAAWAANLPEENISDLVDVKAGRPIQWIPGKGWKGAAR